MSSARMRRSASLQRCMLSAWKEFIGVNEVVPAGMVKGTSQEHPVRRRAVA